MGGRKACVFHLVVVLAIAVRASRGQVLDCNFERDLCQWRQVTGTDNLDWRRRSGSTPSPNTGPSFDHTTGRNGSYIYFDSSQGTEGAKAQLYSPLLTVGRNNYTCLTFWYHMYGEHVSTLTLYHNKTRLWTRSGDQGNVWLQARITITAILHEEIVIEAAKGRGVKGDIAIDDISYRFGPCPAQAILRPTRQPGTTGPTPAPVALSCDFETSDLCGYRQDRRDHFDWVRKAGPSASSHSGPNSDHTMNTNYGKLAS
ncbi:MAM domain-containing glycosylphosphatidylinositol anchor protein 2-like [Pomacea canaliculata]|uniref:MAM domain-containing glycosylphosphatidylinositol anchor protein 2-like n=1 Tax=Pomacea canaliculata TaxID=400727 RepID=UPI000D7359B4|nr:MAM domain-containing glycosylphosphatidylinositol anchor protein 2-like [Pomacea canaliculata]